MPGTTARGGLEKIGGYRVIYKQGLSIHGHANPNNSISPPRYTSLHVLSGHCGFPDHVLVQYHHHLSMHVVIWLIIRTNTTWCIGRPHIALHVIASLACCSGAAHTRMTCNKGHV